MIDPKKVKKLEPKEASREKRLKISTEAAGGCCIKFFSKGDTGWPDRILVLPGGVTWWIELKRDSGKVRPLQVLRGKQLTELGHKYILLDTDEKMNTFIALHLKPIKITALPTWYVKKNKLSKYL